MASSPIRATLTPRGAGALSGVVVLFLLAFYAANLLLFVIAVFLTTLVGVELLSFARETDGFGPAALSAERSESSSFVEVGGTGFAAVRVSSGLEGSFYAEVADVCPAPLAVLAGAPQLLTWWEAGAPLSLAYVFASNVRGYFELGPVTVTAHDALGLATKTVVLGGSWPVEAAAVPSGALAPPFGLPSGVLGETRRLTVGPGSEFRTLREYVPGDEVRHIAWTRSASGKLYVRDYERESQQDLLVLLDVGERMRMGLVFEEALEHAVTAAGAALRRAFDEGGRCGVALFASRIVEFEPPRRGWVHEFAAFRTLNRAAIRDEPSFLVEALDRLAPQLHRPTSVLAFSLPADDPTRFGSAFGDLRRAGHRVYARIPDPREMFPSLPHAPSAEAFRILLAPEAQRADAVAAVLSASGASVERFGRTDAGTAVPRRYFADPSAPRGEP